jgi:hypothetical protein
VSFLVKLLQAVREELPLSPKICEVVKALGVEGIDLARRA